MNGLQSITDGFHYQPSFLFAFKEKEDKMERLERLPGLETLSDLTKLKNHRLITQASLGSVDWKPLFSMDPMEEIPEDYMVGIDHTDQLAKWIDSFATDHVNGFLGHYGLKLPYEVEHKIKNTAYKIAYFKKAHNLSTRVFSGFVKASNGSRTKNPSLVEYNTKFRGVGKEESEKIQNISNIQNSITLLESLNLSLPDIFPPKIVLRILVEGLSSAIFESLPTNYKIALQELMRGINTSIMPYLEIITLEQKARKFTKVSDHLNSLEKRKKDPTAALILPGYKIPTTTTFKFTSTDLPSYNVKHHRYSKSKKNSEDCAADFLKNAVPVVLTTRVKTHKNRMTYFKNIDKKIKKNI